MTLGFIVETILVSASGALSPGPLSAAAVSVGAMGLGPLGGLLVALGHTVFELPYVLVLAKLLKRGQHIIQRVELILAVILATVIVYFARGLTADAEKILANGVVVAIQEGYRLDYIGATIAGIVFTGLNPYFLLWWATIGLPLIEKAVRGGPKLLAIMYASHVWLDYAWLGLLAAAASTALLHPLTYAALLLFLAAILLWFGTRIVFSSTLSNLNMKRRLRTV